MNRIVPWHVAMILVIIGTYAAVLASGGSEQDAAVAAVFTLVVPLFAATLVAAATGTTAAVADVVAVVVADYAAAGAAAAVAVDYVIFAYGVYVAAAGTVAVVAIGKDLGIPKRWAGMACGIGMGVIFSALLTGNIGWALAIGAVGTLALLAVWKFGPKAVSAATAPALAPNGG